MSQWVFNLDNYSHDKAFELAPQGDKTKDYKVRIVEVSKEERRGMILIKISLSPLEDENRRFYRYLKIDESRPEETDQAFGAFYYSFGIPAGDLCIYDWEGKVGLIREAPAPENSLYPFTFNFIPRERPGKFDRIASAIPLKGVRRCKGATNKQRKRR
nr:hypothetical protein [uncultured Dethiosulfovibrio sp.]